MRFFNLFLVFLLFFFVACNPNGVHKINPDDEGDSTAVSDDDSDADSADSDTASDGDHSDSGKPDGDSSDSGKPDGDSSDSGKPDGDQADTDDPNNDNDVDPNPDEDNSTSPDYAEKCANAGGTWDSSEQNCYRVETCSNKPENSEWNGDSSYKVYYDVNAGEWIPGPAYATQYGEGEPQPCQYVCAANALPEGPAGDECKLICSAVFNGTDSKITIASEDAPSIVGLEGWTIEAWIKQSADKLPDYQVYPVLRKGTSTGNPEYLLSGYYNGSNSKGYGLTASTYYSYMQYNQPKTANNQVNATLNTFPEGWSHVAMVYNQETNQYGGGGGWTTYKLTVFINGNLAKTGNYSGAPTFVPNNEPLVFGARNSDRYFTGLIDSIRISNTARYTANFEPAKLSADDNTIAFWDFSGDAKDAKSGKYGVETKIQYSTDCKEE